MRAIGFRHVRLKIRLGNIEHADDDEGLVGYGDLSVVTKLASDRLAEELGSLITYSYESPWHVRIKGRATLEIDCCVDPDRLEAIVALCNRKSWRHKVTRYDTMSESTGYMYCFISKVPPADFDLSAIRSVIVACREESIDSFRLFSG